LLLGRLLSGSYDFLCSSLGFLDFDFDKSLGLLFSGSNQLRARLSIFTGLFLEFFLLASSGSLSLTLLLVEDVLGLSLLSLEFLLGLTLDLAFSSSASKCVTSATGSALLPEDSRFSRGASSFSLELSLNFSLLFLGLLLLFSNFPVNLLLGLAGLTLDTTDSLLMASVVSIFRTNTLLTVEANGSVSEVTLVRGLTSSVLSLKQTSLRTDIFSELSLVQDSVVESAR